MGESFAKVGDGTALIAREAPDFGVILNSESFKDSLLFFKEKIRCQNSYIFENRFGKDA